MGVLQGCIGGAETGDFFTIFINGKFKSRRWGSADDWEGEFIRQRNYRLDLIGMVFRPIELTTGTLIFCKWDLASTEAVHSNPLRKRVPVSSSKGIGNSSRHFGCTLSSCFTGSVWLLRLYIRTSELSFSAIWLMSSTEVSSLKTVGRADFSMTVLTRESMENPASCACPYWLRIRENTFWKWLSDSFSKRNGNPPHWTMFRENYVVPIRKIGLGGSSNLPSL